MNEKETSIPKERVIRDSLAQDLSILESGLRLLQVELHLKNPDGASGSIDIFAQDRYDQKVIIELKRSDQSARQALHEVLKYVELLKRHKGLTDSDLRVMIVSTTWHELLIPFSSFKRDASFPVEGYRIITSPDGKVLNASRVTPLNRPEVLAFPRDHGIFLYSKENDRDQSAKKISEELIEKGVPDHVLFSINYKGELKHLPYKFGVYVAIAEKETEDAKTFLEDKEVLEDYLEDLAGSDLPEGEFWKSTYIDHVLGEVCMYCDEFQIGNPEKAKSISQDWTLQSVTRTGRWDKTVDIYSNEELWESLYFLKGGNTISFERSGSPKFKKRWQEMKMGAEQSLLGCSKWENFYLPYLDKIEKKDSESDVQVEIYTHFDLLMAMYKKIAEDDFRYFPRMQLMVQNKAAKETRWIFSAPAWNGEKPRVDIETLVEEAYGKIDRYQTSNIFGEHYLYFEQMLNACNLTLPIYELARRWGEDEEVSELVIRDGRIRKRPIKFHPQPFDTMPDFFELNPEFCERLLEFFQKHVCMLGDFYR